MKGKQQSALVVNGKSVSISTDTKTSLLNLLRNELQLTGTKAGCAAGNCGACTVLVNNTAVQSCQISLSAAIDTDVQTIEHIVQTPLGSQITGALIRHDAAQCGYCLPGIVVAAYAELLNAESPDAAHALQRNLCRCGSHSRILTALREVIVAQDA